MVLRKKLLQDSKLYLILDAQVRGYDELICIAKESIDAGVDIIQLRDKVGFAADILKVSKQLKEISRGKALFIVNDRVDIAIASGADGVHLGQDDMSIADARGLVDDDFIVGISCQSLAHAQEAQNSGADYIGFGSVFKTFTKPEREPMEINRLESVVKEIDIPLFAIGGINIDNVVELKNIGCSRVAVCRVICESKDIGKDVLLLKKEL